MNYRDLAFAGQPLPCRIIDAHTHIGPYFLSGWQQKKDKLDLKSHIELMDQLGIDSIITAPHAMVQEDMQTANVLAAQAAQEYSGRIYGYFSVVPSCGVDAIRTEFRKYQDSPAFVGLKLLAAYHGDLKQKEYDYAFGFANEMCCPVLIHIWKNAPPLTQAEEVLKKYPNIQMMLAHQGGGVAEETVRCVPLVKNYENLHIEICGSLNNTYNIDDMVDMFGADRVIFGTDSINLNGRYDFGRVAFSLQSDRVKQMIFAENFLRLLEKSHLAKL